MLLFVASQYVQYYVKTRKQTSLLTRIISLFFVHVMNVIHYGGAYWKRALIEIGALT